MRSLGERLNLLRKRVNPPPQRELNRSPAHAASRKLIALKCGPGAAVLPPEVTRIHMDFASKINGGHMGARKFWRENLPRLKYHNPAVPMIVNRHDQSASPPTLSIYLRAASSSPDAAPPTTSASTSAQPASSNTNQSKPPPPAADERVVSIDLKDKHSSAILELFLAETRARALQPTKDEVTEMQALETLERDAAVDRERVRQLRAEKKKEMDMLKRARAAGGMADHEAA